MRVTDEQLKTLNEFHAICCRHPQRMNLRRQFSLECLKVVGVYDDDSIIAKEIKSIAIWLVTPAEAIKRVEEITK